MSIKYILTAVPARMKVVEYLQKHIPDLIVVLDEEYNPWKNWRKAWDLYQDQPSVRLQDDILLTKNFVKKIESAIAERPDEIINFFSMRKADHEIGSRHCAGATWLMNQCHYLPAGVPKLLTDFMDRQDQQYFIEHGGGDDFMMAECFKHHKLKYYQHVPSLVQHLKTKSMLGRRSTTRFSDTFSDAELMK
jgi:hypothetical protein